MNRLAVLSLVFTVLLTVAFVAALSFVFRAL